MASQTVVIICCMQGTERLGQDLLDKMDANLALFQQLCKAAIFNVPPVHAVQTAPMAVMMPAASPLGRTPLRSEQDLDARLESLRMQLRQASGVSRFWATREGWG